MKKADVILMELAELFRRKNQQYGDNYLEVGRVYERLFPEGVVLKDAEDFNRFLIFAMIVHKVLRLRNGLLVYTKNGHETVVESARDLSVYGAMLLEMVGEE